jgi:hypothetical protein
MITDESMPMRVEQFFRQKKIEGKTHTRKRAKIFNKFETPIDEPDGF